MPLPLAVTATLSGEYRWIEHALYALLGQWVLDVPLASVQVHLDAQSMRHAWHAELWADRLPQLARSDHDRLTVPSSTTAALFTLLGVTVPATSIRLADGGSIEPPTGLSEEPLELPGVLPRLAGLYRVVLPRLVVSYQRHLSVTAAPTGGPIVANASARPQRRDGRLVRGGAARAATHDPAARRRRGGRLPAVGWSRLLSRRAPARAWSAFRARSRATDPAPAS